MNSDRRQFFKRRSGLLLTLALLAVAGWLTARLLRDMDWSAVGAALSSYGGATLTLAMLATLIGYIAVCQYDLVGRRYTGHSLALRRVLAISFIGYTFSLNLGGFIGGVGFRYRLYSNAGLPLSTATKVIGLSILGNWSGFVLLGGLLFTFAPPALPPAWSVGPTTLRALGIFLLLSIGAYTWLCWRHAGRSRNFRRLTLEVPSLPIAAVQFSLSLTSWCAAATTIYALLPDEVSWLMVLATLLTSVVAALLAHVPGGIGVIELVFIVMLGHLAPESTILAALLVYRCVYYLQPLLLAVLVYFSMELLHSPAKDGMTQNAEKSPD